MLYHVLQLRERFAKRRMRHRRPISIAAGLLLIAGSVAWSNGGGSEFMPLKDDGGRVRAVFTGTVIAEDAESVSIATLNIDCAETWVGVAVPDMRFTASRPWVTYCFDGAEPVSFRARSDTDHTVAWTQGVVEAFMRQIRSASATEVLIVASTGQSDADGHVAAVFDVEGYADAHATFCGAS